MSQAEPLQPNQSGVEPLLGRGVAKARQPGWPVMRGYCERIRLELTQFLPGPVMTTDEPPGDNQAVGAMKLRKAIA